MPIEAHSKSVSELISSSQKYIVPEYQRPFSWKVDKQIRELWEDIQELIDDRRETHFLGAMIFYNEGSAKIIVDGQQRIASLIMLIAAIRDHLIPLNEKEAQKIQLRKIEYEHASGEFTLVLNEYDREFFRKYIQEWNNDVEQKLNEMRKAAEESNIPSHREIYRTYKFFYNSIRELIAKENDIVQKVNKLLEIYNRILNKMYVVTINLQNEDDAYIVFETLNERGLPLSTADMLKNYLLSKTPPESRRSVLNLWNAIEKAINSVASSMSGATRTSIYDDFLRYYCTYSYRKATKRNLYPILKEKIKKEVESGRVGIVDFVDELRKDAENYAKLLLPKGSGWPEQVIEKLLDINEIIEMKQHIRLLIPAARLPQEEFAKWIDFCWVIGFRYVVFNRGNPRALENPFDILARHLYESIEQGQYTTFEDFMRDLLARKKPDLKDKIKSLYLGSEEEKKELINKLKSMPFKDRRWRNRAKYLLMQLNRKILEKQGIRELKLPSIHSEEAKDIWLEHIIPESRSDILRDRDSVNKLGNLTIIYEQWNREMQDKPFHEKVKYYARSQIPTTRKLAERYGIEDWDLKDPERVIRTINSRGEELAREIIELFRLEPLEEVLYES